MSKKKDVHLKIKAVEDKMLSYKEQKDIMIKIIKINESIAQKEKMIKEAQAKLVELGEDSDDSEYSWVQVLLIIYYYSFSIDLDGEIKVSKQQKENLELDIASIEIELWNDQETKAKNAEIGKYSL